MSDREEAAALTRDGQDYAHLPECEEFNKDARVWCICPFLRACEQRILAEGCQHAQFSSIDTPAHASYRAAGYAAALDALARDLLTDAPYYIKAEEIRTAINTLKVEQP